MAIKKKLFSLIKNDQIGNSLQARVLCDTIEKLLLLNYLQHIIVKETLYHAITVGRNQCNLTLYKG